LATSYANLLNGFMKNRYIDDRIVAENIIEVHLLEALTENIDRVGFDSNGNVKISMQLTRARNARALSDGSALPATRSSSYVEQTIPVKRIVAVAGLTEKAMKAAKGGLSSYGVAAGRAIDDMLLDFKYAQNLACHGNGSGCLARISSVAAFDTDHHVITCDNTYRDSGAENTDLIQEDMYVSIWDADTSAFVADGSGATEFLVSAVAPGKRVNGTYTATTGTVTIQCSSDLSASVEDNDFIYLAGSKDEMPMGLAGIIANNGTVGYDDDLAAPWITSTFQGLTRTTYKALLSDVWQATDFGLTSESPADGTLTLWDLSVITDAINNVRKRGGKTNLIRCHPDMATTMHRLNRDGGPIQVIVDNTKQLNQPVIGSMTAKFFLGLDGEMIPIFTDWCCPRYVIEGMDTRVMKWHPLGDADYRRDSGDIWGPERGSRNTVVEAGYEWWYELSSERCDWHWRVQDLRIDL
jgi:hypothetical protein